MGLFPFRHIVHLLYAVAECNLKHLLCFEIAESFSLFATPKSIGIIVARRLQIVVIEFLLVCLCCLVSINFASITLSAQ